MSDEDDIKELPEEQPAGTVKHETARGTYLLPVKALSPSSADMYPKCPRQYYFRYVEGIKSPPGIAQLTGISGHEAVEENARHKIKKGKDLPTKTVVEDFKDRLSTHTKGVEDWEGTSKDEIIDSLEPSITDFMETLAPTLEPVAVEQVFRLSLDGLPVIGFMDQVEKKEVIDYKFCGRTSGYLKREVVEESLQLGTYAMGGRKRKTTFLCITKDARKTKLGEAVRVSTSWSDKKLEGVTEQYHHVAKGISAGSFPLCPPGSWYCSAKWCGYFSRCRGSKKTESQLRKGA